MLNVFWRLLEFILKSRSHRKRKSQDFLLWYKGMRTQGSSSTKSLSFSEEIDEVA